MHLSIVTGTYKRLPLLTQFLNSCRDQIPAGILYEFVITGVAGDDDTLDYLRTQPDVKLIVHEGLLGAVKAFTDACELATGRYVLIANDDVQIIEGSILNALVHLEETPTCGAVAFRDNRLNNDAFKAAYVPAIKPDGRQTTFPYVQIGMVRGWLGAHVGWWSLHGTFPARTYAADNAMSAAIIETGYTIDDIEGCRAIDYMHHDELRDINTAVPDGRDHPDSIAYYDRWPRGPQIPHEVTVNPPKPNAREIGLRILYLPIFEAGGTPGTPPSIRRGNQIVQKRGLRDALSKVGMVYEFDYLTYQYHTAELWQELAKVLSQFKPDLLFTQVHATDVLTLDIIRNVRMHCPRLVIVNWNGDYWPEAQTNPRMMDWLRFVDLALVVNADVLKTYEDTGITAAYWQASYEHPPGVLPDMPAHDVVFLGQQYHPERRVLGDHLAELRNEGIDVAIYGSGWNEGGAYPDCTYDFQTARALYGNAKITLGNNHFPDNYGFVSDRIFHALAGNGAILLHQHVKGLQELTGLTPDVHFVEWNTYAELKYWTRYFLDPAHEAKRQEIVANAWAFAQSHHSFDARLRQLFTEFLPMAKTKLRRAVSVQYMGRRNSPFGVKGGKTQNQYQCVPGVPLVIDALDLDLLLQVEPGLWEEIGTPQGDVVAEAARG